MLDLNRFLNLFERLVLTLERLSEVLPQVGAPQAPRIPDDAEVDWRVVRDELDLTAGSATVINRKIGTSVPKPTGTPGPRGAYRWVMGEVRRFKKERHLARQARLSGSTLGASTRSAM